VKQCQELIQAFQRDGGPPLFRVVSQGRRYGSEPHGRVQTKVSGSEISNVRIVIKTIPVPRWRAMKKRCAGQMGSLLELLQGRRSDNVMRVVTDREQGLFPLPGEMSFSCDCPDWASMCKYIAAVLYSVGARLEKQPERLFQLRSVNHEQLIDANIDAHAAVDSAATAGQGKTPGEGSACGRLWDRD
jgi:uncharacterized Zn finger protein